SSLVPVVSLANGWPAHGMDVLTLVLAITVVLLVCLLFKKYVEEKAINERSMISASENEVTLNDGENTIIPSVTGVSSLQSSDDSEINANDGMEVGAQSSNMSSDMSNVASTSDATMTTSDSTTSESATTSTITSNTNMSANITSPKLLFGRSVQHSDSASTHTAIAPTSVRRRQIANEMSDSLNDDNQDIQMRSLKMGRIPPWELEREAYDPQNLWNEEKHLK
uniref:Uncharacterized protein n=1 Tax=Parascaris univalens TaxID=6257 RepID=A0A915BVV0_PARUN